MSSTISRQSDGCARTARSAAVDVSYERRTMTSPAARSTAMSVLRSVSSAPSRLVNRSVYCLRVRRWLCAVSLRFWRSAAEAFAVRLRAGRTPRPVDLRWKGDVPAMIKGENELLFRTYEPRTCCHSYTRSSSVQATSTASKSSPRAALVRRV